MNQRMMARALAAVLLGVAAVWALVAMQAAPAPSGAALLPDGALLALQAKDFHALLGRWNGSPQQRTWLTSDNYADFSRSRLFSRLGQAQDDFADVAGIPVDVNLLQSVAGHESALALYDFSELAFVYVTRMDQAAVEATPLWQVRGRFEPRSEAGVTFYLRQDAQGKRVAAFAANDGWLILGTRADLVAGVLDRLHPAAAQRRMVDEAWYAAAVKQAGGTPGDLRLVLNFDKVVPSALFRGYWVQGNGAAMKAYTAAISDLYCEAPAWREQRVLLRPPDATPPVPSSDVSALAALPPAAATYWSARAAPDPATVFAKLRNDLLDPRPAEYGRRQIYAPPAPAMTAVGSAADLETRIDQAPTAPVPADAWQSLRGLLTDVPPSSFLDVYSFPASAPASGIFVPVSHAAVLASRRAWDEAALREAITTALGANLTAGRLGVTWEARPTGYAALNGAVELFEAVRGERLYLANNSSLLAAMLANDASAASAKPYAGVNYAAVFNHRAPEQVSFHLLAGVLDGAGGGSGPPAFFSGNVESLSRVFADVTQESIEQRDQGSTVVQTMRYLWNH